MNNVVKILNDATITYKHIIWNVAFEYNGSKYVALFDEDDNQAKASLYQYDESTQHCVGEEISDAEIKDSVLGILEDNVGPHSELEAGDEFDILRSDFS